MSRKESTKWKNKGGGILDWIENIGNKLPHPVVLFIILALIVIGLSHLSVILGLSATGEDITVYAQSLMNKEGISDIFNNAASNFTGFPLLLAFIILAMFLDLFLGSASAKWAIMAPIFVPMLFQLGLTPELAQEAYRIADSVVNVITPLMSYFAMVLVFMKRYDKRSGLGTLVSTMLPYSISFAIGWVILLGIWYLFGLPLGPGAPITF